MLRGRAAVQRRQLRDLGAVISTAVNAPKDLERLFPRSDAGSDDDGAQEGQEDRPDTRGGHVQEAWWPQPEGSPPL